MAGSINARSKKGGWDQDRPESPKRFFSESIANLAWLN
jgi:hypothetical protein